MRSARALIALVTTGILLPAIAAAQSSAPTTLQALARSAATILNDGAILLITASVAVYFYSIAGDIYKISQGEADGGDLKKTLLWGILIIFAMVSIWGIIQILQFSLFGGPPPSASSNGVIIYQN